MSFRLSSSKIVRWIAVVGALLLWPDGMAWPAPDELSALTPPAGTDAAHPRSAGVQEVSADRERRHMTVADHALFISKVFVTYGDIRCGGADTIEVHGENFLGSEEVFVGLGNRGPLTLCRAATPQLIIGKLPLTLGPGSFLLSVSKGTATSDFDLFDLTIGPRRDRNSLGVGSSAVWKSAEFRLVATGESRTLRCPADHPQVLTGGFRITGRRANDRAHVNRPVRGVRPQPDGWEVGVDPDGQADGRGRALRFSIDIVCSR